MKFSNHFSLLALLTLMGVIAYSPAHSQAGNDEPTLNTVTTAVPFLRINPDARSGAMGDVGIATSPDANSNFHNPSKLAFAEKDFGLSASYSPWLRAIVDEVYLAQLAGYKRIDDVQTLGMSIRYFSLGNIQFTNYSGQNTGEFRPNEFAIDGSYARKLSDKFSLGTGLRFIYSNLASGQSVNGVEIKPGMAAAADVAFYYNNPIQLGERDARFTMGMNISNIGSKITYTESTQKDFLPMNLGLGTGLSIDVDEANQFNIAADINKLLVPTPDPDNPDARFDVSVPSGAINSFTDAPGGASEELQELMYSLGVEYWYDQTFGVRAGYFNEHKFKGNRKFFTAGLGLKYSVFGLDFSYLIPTNNQRNPLDNTLRFTLNFDFAALKTPQQQRPAQGPEL